MSDILVVGESLIDIVIPVSGDAVEHVGGSPANVALGTARLGHRTQLATYVGADERGRRIIDTLTAEGVSLAPGIPGRRTSTATAHVDSAGRATYDFDLCWELPDDLVAPTDGHLHTGSVAATLEPGGTQVHRLIEQSRELATISYDPNIRPSLMGSPAAVAPRIDALIALSDVVKASDEDVAWLYGPDTELDTVLARWLAEGPALAVITRGAEGALVAVRGEVHEIPARPVVVADTVGAGDAFMSGLISGLTDAGLLGGAAARVRLGRANWTDVRPAVERASACSAITVTRPGANPPRRHELA